MTGSSSSFIRGFFAGIFAMGALNSMILLMTPTAASLRPLAAVNLPVALVLAFVLYRRDLRTRTAGPI